MPSDPKAAASSSSSSRDKEKSSSSSSSSARPSSSSSSSSSPPPPQGPYISANAWMSFFLFCCLVLIILQGPLGLSSIGTGLPTALGGLSTAMVGMGGGIGCQGMAAAYVPWCFPPALGAGVQVQAIPMQPAPAPAVVHHHHAAPVVRRSPQRGYYGHQPDYGAQGSILLPGGGGGGQWSWYGNWPHHHHHQHHQQVYRHAPQRQLQYHRPGLNVQVNQGNPAAAVQVQGPGGYYLSLPPGEVSDYGYTEWEWAYDYLCYHHPSFCQPIFPYAYAHAAPAPNSRTQQVASAPAPAPVVPVPVAAPVTAPSPILSASTMMGITNLESAFFPLLVGAIALLVIFDYSS